MHTRMCSLSDGLRFSKFAISSTEVIVFVPLQARRKLRKMHGKWYQWVRHECPVLHKKKNNGELGRILEHLGTYLIDGGIFPMRKSD